MDPSSKIGWLTERPIAHRGLHDEANGVIENSLTAVKAAIAEGFAIEVDVQLTGDARAAVFHDHTLDRLTPETGKVVDRTMASLEAIPLNGSKTADRIYAFETLLDVVQGRVPLVVELKSSFNLSKDLAQAVAEASLGYQSPLAFMSFDPFLVRALKDTMPKQTRGLVSYRYDDQNAKQVPFFGRFALRHLLPILTDRPDFIAYDCRGLPAPGPSFARRFFNLPVLSWTVRSNETAQRIAPHVNQIIFEGYRPV